ncbi:MAG TPA: phosphotransferase, partial [Urbifossiella sp.]
MGRLDEGLVAALTERIGVGPVRAIAPIEGGANNRVFRLETADAAFLLKSYFRHPDDPRDRLAAEFAFAQFAWNHGVRCIPQPLACDAAAGLGLFEFVFGQSLKGSVAGEAAVDQAIDFFRTLNRSRYEEEAAKLPRASESCMSLDDHFHTVNRRVERLQSIEAATGI